jgi:hypothetical protein
MQAFYAPAVHSSHITRSRHHVRIRAVTTVRPNECRLKFVLLTHLTSQYIARLYAGLAGDRQSCDMSVNAMHLQLYAGEYVFCFYDS